MNTDSNHSVLERLGNSQLYKDYEHAFNEATGLPLVLSPVDDWHLAHRDTLKALHAVARSRIVRMGVTVANLALGKITSHDNRSTFEAALRKLEHAQPSV